LTFYLLGEFGPKNLANTLHFRKDFLKAMHPMQQNSYSFENVMYPSEPKACARQIVKNSIDRILAGKFDVPALEEMESILSRNFENLFDEHHAIQSIQASHPAWDKLMILDELDRQRRFYERKLRERLRAVSVDTINEIENLIASLNEMIRNWKVLNL